MSKNLAEFLGVIVAQLLIVAIVALVNALVLRWRARVLRSWDIKFKDAYLVSIKAGVAAVVVSDLLGVGIAFSGIGNDQLYRDGGMLAGLVSWWFVHSNGLLSLAGPSSLLSPRDARKLSASVFAYVFGISIALWLVVMAAILMIASVFTH